jgi:hypothetical protein
LTLNPDTLQWVSGEELKERQVRTGEVGNGLTVYCVPNLDEPGVMQQVSRVTCSTRPYSACPYCPHSRFELILKKKQDPQGWVMCPRWKNGSTVGEPNFYTIVTLTECTSRPYSFCPQCPDQQELVLYDTDKQKQGWVSRYRRLLMEKEDD